MFDKLRLFSNNLSLNLNLSHPLSAQVWLINHHLTHSIPLLCPYDKPFFSFSNTMMLFLAHLASYLPIWQALQCPFGFLPVCTQTRFTQSVCIAFFPLPLFLSRQRLHICFQQHLCCFLLCSFAISNIMLLSTYALLAHILALHHCTFTPHALLLTHRPDLAIANATTKHNYTYTTTSAR